MGSWGINPRILNLSSRKRWVISFALRPLYPKGKKPSTLWIGEPEPVCTRWPREKFPSLPLPKLSTSHPSSSSSSSSSPSLSPSCISHLTVLALWSWYSELVFPFLKPSFQWSKIRRAFVWVYKTNLWMVTSSTLAEKRNLHLGLVRLMAQEKAVVRRTTLV